MEENFIIRMEYYLREERVDEVVVNDNILKEISNM